MRRIVAACLLATAALGFTAAPANAACSNPVDVACQEHDCEPGTPCTIEICVVWLNGVCVVG